MANKTKKKTSASEVRKQFEKKLSSVFSHLELELGEKRFKTAMKNASKAISEQLKKAIRTKAGKPEKKSKKKVLKPKLPAPNSTPSAPPDS
jgi:hypothetical protein